MNKLKKLLYILSWIPMLVIRIGLMILGLVAVPIALMFDEAKLWHWPKLLWLWGNDEEGCPMWWYQIARIKGGFIARFPRFWWYAVRNPVNNFRFIFKDREAHILGNWHTASMEAHDLIDAGVRVAYRWAYNGPFAGYRRVWITILPEAGFESVGEYSEFWIGWKVGSKVPGMGFTLQYRRNREIGT